MSSQTQQLPNNNVHLLKRWTFTPPHGMRFVNEQGGDVTCYFEEGREQELYQALFIQLQQHINNHLQTNTLPPSPAQEEDNHRIVPSPVTVLGAHSEKVVETVKHIVEGDK